MLRSRAGLALALTNNKVDFTAMKVDMTWTRLQNSPVALDSAGTAIMQGYVNLKLFGTVVIA